MRTFRNIVTTIMREFPPPCRRHMKSDGCPEPHDKFPSIDAVKTMVCYLVKAGLIQQSGLCNLIKRGLIVCPRMSLRPHVKVAYHP